MSDSWRLYFEDALAAHRAGQHELASRLVRQHRLTRERPGQRLARAIARALLQEARRATQQLEFFRAWTALHEARLMSPHGIAFRQERSRLIEKTLQSAVERICRGEMPQAKGLLRHFDRFHVTEPRAVGLVTAVEQIEQARQLASEGRFGEAATCVDRAIRLAPKLQSFRHQRDLLVQRREVCQREIERLRKSLVAEDWNDVQLAADRLLQMAPALQMAKDAAQIARQELDRQAKPLRIVPGSLLERDERASRHGSSQTSTRMAGPDELEAVRQVPPGRRAASGQTANAMTTMASSSNKLNSKSTTANSHVAGSDATTRHSTTSPMSSRIVAASTASESVTSLVDEAIQRRFVMWIDGVGGYLVCTEDEISLGQALPDGGVDIPIQGDLSRRHLKIHRDPDTDALEPFGEVFISGKPIEERTLLKSDEIWELGRGVLARYRRPHPLSTSARIELLSRHRTHPWTDGILLLGDSLILGSNSQSHVICPQWDQELIFFRRDDRLWVRSTSAIEVDGVVQTDATPLSMSSRLVGPQFAISFERC